MPRAFSVRFSIASVLCACSLCAVCRAQEPGGGPASFLQRSWTAAQGSFGGIPFPFSNEASSIFDDASSLARLRGTVAVASASLFPDGQQQVSAGVAVSVGDAGGLSLGVAQYSAGSFRGFTADDRFTGTMRNSDIALSLAGGISLGPAAIGATVRYLNSSLAGAAVAASGYAVDLSGSLSFIDRIVVGARVSNVAGQVDWAAPSNEREALPWQLRVGASYLIPLEEHYRTIRDRPTGIASRALERPKSYVAVAVQESLVQYGESGATDVGVAWAPSEEIPLELRAGAGTVGDVGAGFGYTLHLSTFPRIRFDFSVRLDHDLSRPTEHVSITAGF